MNLYLTTTQGHLQTLATPKQSTFELLTPRIFTLGNMVCYDSAKGASGLESASVPRVKRVNDNIFFWGRKHRFLSLSLFENVPFVAEVLLTD